MAVKDSLGEICSWQYTNTWTTEYYYLRELQKMTVLYVNPYTYLKYMHIVYCGISKLTLTHDEGLIPPGHETGRCLVQTFTFFVLIVGLPTSCRLLWSEFFLSHTSCHHTPSDWNPLLHSKSFLPLFQFVHMKLICYISALSAIMVRTFILQICII